MHYDKDDLSLIRACAQPLFTMLRGREARAISTLCAKFSAGDRDLLTDVARLVEVRAQIAEITNALKLEEKERASEFAK